LDGHTSKLERKYTRMWLSQNGTRKRDICYKSATNIIKHMQFYIFSPCPIRCGYRNVNLAIRVCFRNGQSVGARIVLLIATEFRR